MCSGSEAGSYSRVKDFVYHSTLGLRAIKKKKLSSERRALARSRRSALPREARTPDAERIFLRTRHGQILTLAFR